MLAETVQIGGGEVVAILLVLLVLAVLAIGTVVVGFVMAPRAGRGSKNAYGWWVVAVGLEVFACLGSLRGLLQGRPTIGGLVLPVIIAAQVAIYLRARRDAGG